MNLHEIARPRVDTLFKFRKRSFRLEIWGHPEKTLVIATEQNLDRSIATVVHELAGAVVREFGLDWMGLTWIERYPSQTVVHSEMFSKLQFTWNGNRFTAPVWGVTLPKEVEKLIQEHA